MLRNSNIGKRKTVTVNINEMIWNIKIKKRFLKWYRKSEKSPIALCKLPKSILQGRKKRGKTTTTKMLISIEEGRVGGGGGVEISGVNYREKQAT